MIIHIKRRLPASIPRLAVFLGLAAATLAGTAACTPYAGGYSYGYRSSSASATSAGANTGRVSSPAPAPPFPATPESSDQGLGAEPDGLVGSNGSQVEAAAAEADRWA